LIVVGEKPSKYSCGLKSLNISSKTIPKIVKDNGNTIIDPKKLYYGELNCFIITIKSSIKFKLDLLVEGTFGKILV